MLYVFEWAQRMNKLNQFYDCMQYKVTQSRLLGILVVYKLFTYFTYSALLREKTTNLDQEPEKSPTHRIVENYYSMY